ncbi:MAG: glutathione S-transferase family protein [Proteobacteria bacterium]|nr:glutathione S-transferase family protein [Pseudomonadota bacterium]MDA0951169.1 glutathione S-transferase family protein [Pseudomonadota bacterium]MDA1071563.1 glutathione S-transferase family protein [Pseudomonadota bacterium]
MRYTLHGNHESGNCYKVALFFALSGIAYDWKQVDIFAQGTRGAAFTALNPFQEVPVLVHGETVVAQSDVILRYLADTTGRFGGDDAATRLQVQEWMAWTSNKMTSGISLARFGIRFAGFKPEVVEFFQNRARTAFDHVDRHLAGQPWLAGDKPTIADMSAAGYVYLAGEAGLDLTRWKKMLAWMGRLSMQPGWHHPDKLPRSDATVAPAAGHAVPDDD